MLPCAVSRATVESVGPKSALHLFTAPALMINLGIFSFRCQSLLYALSLGLQAKLASFACLRTPPKTNFESSVKHMEDRAATGRGPCPLACTAICQLALLAKADKLCCDILPLEPQLYAVSA